MQFNCGISVNFLTSGKGGRNYIACNTFISTGRFDSLFCLACRAVLFRLGDLHDDDDDANGFSKWENGAREKSENEIMMLCI
jgi:hypothetical protein